MNYYQQGGPQGAPQQGQGADQQQQIMQIIQAYAQMTGVDPKQLMQQLQQMPPQQQQAAIQKMVQAVQQASQQQPQGGGQPQGGQQQGPPQGQPQQRWGGLWFKHGGKTSRSSMRGKSGGGAAQKQIMQIVQAYAQATGVDPNQLMQQLQQMSPDQQKQALAKMVQMLQQGQQGQQQQGQPQQGQPQQQMEQQPQDQQQDQQMMQQRWGGMYQVGGPVGFMSKFRTAFRGAPVKPVFKGFPNPLGEDQKYMGPAHQVPNQSPGNSPYEYAQFMSNGLNNIPTGTYFDSLSSPKQQYGGWMHNMFGDTGQKVPPNPYKVIAEYEKARKRLLGDGGFFKSGGRFMGINPSHKGYCTPMSKSTCTPRRKALARTLKKHHGFHKKQEGGYADNTIINRISSPKREFTIL